MSSCFNTRNLFLGNSAHVNLCFFLLKFRQYAEESIQNQSTRCCDPFGCGHWPIPSSFFKNLFLFSRYKMRGQISSDFDPVAGRGLSNSKHFHLKSSELSITHAHQVYIYSVTLSIALTFDVWLILSVWFFFFCLAPNKNMTVLTFGVATTISFTGSTAPFAAPALAGTLTGTSSSICSFQFIRNRQSTHFF